jgi:Hint domain
MTSNTFTNASGGDWSASTNWSLGSTPDSNANVNFVSGTYTSVVDGSPWTIQSINVNVTTVTLNVDADLTAQTLDGNLGTINVEAGATCTLGSLNSNSGDITVSNNGTLTVQNLNGNNGTITAGADGLVNLQGNGAGSFVVAGGTLAIAGNYNGSGTITMDGGIIWLAGQLGSSSYALGNGTDVDQAFFDSLQSTTTNAITNVDVGDRMGIKDVTISMASYSGTTLTLTTSGGTYSFTDLTVAPGEVASATFGTEVFQGNSYGYVQMACYRRGTPILTPSGEVPVEALRIGDRVVTLSGEAKPIRWIGRRGYGARFVASNHNLLPIRIAANAFADGVPNRDLDVSPKHAMHINDVLVPAEKLVNGISIYRLETSEDVEYFHLELVAHDVIFAANAPGETFVDCDNRGMFQNAAEYAALYPADVGARWAFCAPRVEGGDLLTRVRRELEQRLASSGHTTTFDPDLHLLVDGAELAAELVKGCHYRFRLPQQPADVRMLSRSSIPAEVQDLSTDQRRLGVSLSRLVLSGDHATVTLGYRHPLLSDGFHAAEATHRWTDGNAGIPPELFAGFPNGFVMEVHLRDHSMPYRCIPPPCNAAAAHRPLSSGASGCLARRQSL